MVRGAIEIAQKTRVVGWIHSSTEPVRSKVVLAFVGSRCVGSGEAGGFRKDLLDAGLGDGFCGFDFPVRLNEGEAVGSIIVRLQFSDVALLQPSSRVVGADAAGGPDLGAMQPGRVAWMMDRGMLSQVEYDFLTVLATTGAYCRSLRTGKPGSDAAAQRIPPEAAAADLLGLLMLSEVVVTRTSLAAVSDIATLAPQAAPVLAVWSQTRGRLSLEPPSGGVEHDFGPDRLLFLHRDCRVVARGPAPASGLVVLTGVPAREASVRALAA